MKALCSPAGMDNKKPPTPPGPPPSRRQRRAAITSPPPPTQLAQSNDFDPPMFRVGGKMDPGRFVSQHQQQFMILGFHDEERLDQDDLSDFVESQNSSEEQSHPLRLSLGNLMRNTLSPVREEQVGQGIFIF